MGSIHERLQELHDTVQLVGQERFKLDQLKKEKEKQELLEGERNQYPKLVTLKEKGILAMIADATNTTEIEPEWPLSREEREERDRQRQEAWLEKLKKSQPQDISSIKFPPDSELQNDKSDFWNVCVMPPSVTDKLEWDENIEIVAIKKEYKTRNWQTYPEPVAKVGIKFDGDKLTITGQDVAFSSTIPESEDEKATVLEEAFVRAFFNPENIRVIPAVPPHRHGPQVYGG